MPLDDAEIARLLSLPKRGGGKKKTTEVDTRDYQTWFRLAHRMIDEDTGELMKCENPDCQDVRTRGAVVCLVSEKYMCRICFLSGWLLNSENPPQDEQLDLTGS